MNSNLKYSSILQSGDRRFSVANMNDEDDWTDDEEAIEKEVKRINQLSPSELKDIIAARIPSFSLSSTDGYAFI